jgi:WD40 repeat protein
VTAVSAGADLLASGGVDGTACIWSVDSGRLLHSVKHTDKLDTVALSPDGNILACGGPAKAVFLWNARTGKELGRIEENITARVCALAFSPSGKQLAVATQAELVVFDWVPPNFHLAANPLKGEYVVSAVAYSGDGKRLAACTYGRKVAVWDVATWKQTDAPGQQPEWLEAVALSPDGRRILFANREGHFFSWEPPQPPRLLGTTPRGTSTLACVPGRDAFLLAGEWAGPLRLCDPATQRQVQTFEGAPQEIHSACFASGGQLLVGAGTDGFVYLWDVQTAQGLDH